MREVEEAKLLRRLAAEAAAAGFRCFSEGLMMLKLLF